MAVVALGTPVAFATTKPPGLLRPSDFPGTFEVSGGPLTIAGGAGSSVDAKACREAAGARSASATGGVEVLFHQVGATQRNALIETVTSFRDAGGARQAFARAKKNEAIRLKCGTVAFVPPGGTTPGGITHYQGPKKKLPKIGEGSFIEIAGVRDTESSTTTAVFVAGPYLVTLFVPGLGVDVKDLQAIAQHALKRLPVPTPVGSPTTTTT